MVKKQPEKCQITSGWVVFSFVQAKTAQNFHYYTTVMLGHKEGAFS